MIEKQLSITDILLYFIPGFLTIVLVLALIDSQGYRDLEGIFGNPVLLVTFVVALSICWGFVQSNLSMSFFRYYFKNRVDWWNPLSWFFWLAKKISPNKYQKHQHLDNLDFSEELSLAMHKNYQEYFTVEIDYQKFKTSYEVYYIIMRFVDTYNDTSSNQQAKRSLNLANFASSLLIPLVLVANLIFQHIDQYIWLEMVLIVLISVLFFSILVNQNLTYKKAWSRNYYRNFLVLSQKVLRDRN